ncbi:uncharacterized protein TNCV_1438951 [Trichonephila clavipes]|nr:uncharacterized protein TNCV_1438951 [Trichonephila clavipes]
MGWLRFLSLDGNRDPIIRSFERIRHQFQNTCQLHSVEHNGRCMMFSQEQITIMEFYFTIKSHCHVISAFHQKYPGFSLWGYLKNVTFRNNPHTFDGLKSNILHAISGINSHALRKVSICCQVIYSQFGLAIHQNDHQARRRFVEWAQNEIAVVPDFHKRILFSDEAHFWLNGYVNKQNCRIWSEANPQVYVETPLHPEKLTVWCALWAGGILLQKR